MAEEGEAPNTPEGGAPADPAVEQRARDLGWLPKEEYRGREGGWVDASTWVERGEQILPIMKSNNRRLSDELGRTRAELEAIKRQNTEMADSVEALKEFHAEDTKQKVEEERKRILQGIKDAKRANDVDAEVDLTDQLTQLNAREAEEEEAPAGAKPATGERKDPPLDPDFLAWHHENAWFGTDPRRTGVAMGIAQVLRVEQPDLRGRPFMNAVVAEMNRRLSGSRPARDRVEGAGAGGGASSGNGKSYADLPSEAKATCDRQASRMVGNGRAFKDLASWQKYYVSTYFSPSKMH